MSFDFEGRVLCVVMVNFAVSFFSHDAFPLSAIEDHTYVANTHLNHSQIRPQNDSTVATSLMFKM